jgi:hypothetical protein
MEDAAFEARRTKRLKRHSRIKVVGCTLLGLLLLAIIAGAVTPVVQSALEAARWKRLQTMAYPPPPSAPGVYALGAEPHPSFGGTILSTPPMPVEFDGPARQGPPVRLEVRDFIEGTTRVDPVKYVQLSFNAAPKTWRIHNGKVMTIEADEESVQRAFEGEYDGDGWGLDKEDQLYFSVPTEFFLRMGAAQKVTGTLDGRPFTLTPDEQAALRDFAAYLKPGIAVVPPK